MKGRLRTAPVLVLIFLVACNLPSAGAPTTAPDLMFTAAAQTVEAQLTASSSLSTPTLPPSLPTNTPPPVATPISTPAIPPTAPPTATQVCDKAEFIKDVTIPDGTMLSPGEAFTKTWRLKNIGACTWTTAYALVCDSGDCMSGPSAQPLAGSVAPGQIVDISVPLVAPASPGHYRGYWKLRNAAGVLFAGVYVDINVGSSGFDLYSRAPDAQWVSGAGVLPFGGPDTDNRGFVMYRSGALLENGSRPNKVLETHPQWVNDGVISGEYPAYTVVAGEHFLAKIGFMAKNDGTCGVGDAIFQLNYLEGGTLHPLGEWHETCDGSLRSVNVNLNSLAGKTVQFVLVVMANGSSGQDWAVWVNPRIEIP